MNTRLQVEHPVTELITGVDLVEWQLRVAFGEKLPLTQDQIKLNGHAIKARVYAENPQNFMPSVRTNSQLAPAAAIDGLRIDAGYREGDAVSPYYDAMLAKLIAWAPDRETAIDDFNRALEQSDIRGIVSNAPFLSALVTHPAVRTNAIDTGFIERELEALTEASKPAGDLEFGAAIAAILGEEREGCVRRTGLALAQLLAGCRSEGGNGYSRSGATGGRAECDLALRHRADDTLHRQSRIRFRDVGRGRRHVRSDDRRYEISCHCRDRGPRTVSRTRNGRFDLHWVDPFGGETEEQVGEDKIVAPLPGTVVALLAKEGETLEKGAAILTLEVMKMEQMLRAPFAGVLKKIKCKVGDIVGEGVELAEIELDNVKRSRPHRRSRRARWSPEREDDRPDSGQDRADRSTLRHGFAYD